MVENRPSWSSRFAFILAAVGSAVGLGNIWRFPYIMGQNGGAIFLLVYLGLILTICFIPLFVELAIGKITKKDCVSAYETINPKFKILGMLNPLTCIVVSSFYFIVGGWIINYIFLGFKNAQILDYGDYFVSFTQDSVSACIYTVLFLLITVLFAARGVNKGIEFANKILMPIFAVILVCLIVFSLNLPNANLGLEYMFKPDLTKVNAQMFLAALGQALFTLSIGMGTLITYGSYINDNKNIAKSAYTIIFYDTLFALLAGIMIFPAIFSFGLEPSSGAGLVFVIIPQIFAKIAHGNIVSIAFFILLFAAAITSGISIIEVPIASMLERWHLSRKKACFILFCSVLLLAIPATLSFGILSDFKILGKTIFEFLDYLTANVLMPLNALFLCLIAGWFFKLKGEQFIQNKIIVRLFNFGLCYIIPLILISLLYIGHKI